MARIFISYRRQDTEPFAVALKEELERRLGAGSIFIDTSSIDSGVHFPDAIARALGQASVVLVLIGRRWLTATDTNGVARLTREDDWVRREVRDALRARQAGRLRVIPVLLQDARVPSASDLPEDLRGLSDLNGFVLGGVATDSARLADIVERRHSVLEPAIVMALAAGLGLLVRSAHRWVARGVGHDDFHPGSLEMTRWFLELAGTSLYYAVLVLGVMVAVRTRTGWRAAEMARVVACTALGIAATHTVLAPLLSNLRTVADGRMSALFGMTLTAASFIGAAIGTAIGVDRYAPTLRVERRQWWRLGVAVLAMGVAGSALQYLVTSSTDSAAWLRNPRTLFWGPVLLGFAASWQSDRDGGGAAATRRIPWDVVVPVLLTMLAADFLAVLTSPWLATSSISPVGQRLLEAKDAWNHALFFGLVAAVAAWRLNRNARDAAAALPAPGRA